MNKLFLAGLIILLVIIYRPSFVSPFFQDDALLLKYASPAYFLTPVPPFHYHPIANQIFYFLGKSLFGMNVTGYHLLLFIATSLSLVFIYKLAKILLPSKNKAIFTTFFYAFNVSLFANFYWIAVSYFVLGGLFFFACAWSFFQKNKIMAPITLLLFALSAGSNELAIFLVPIFVALAWYRNYWPKRLYFLFGVDVIVLASKIFWVGFSSEQEYSLKFDVQALSTFRWYLLRALNLPEGVNRVSDNLFVFFAVLILLIFVFCLVTYFRSKKRNIKLFLLAVLWFVIGALPFYFLPRHMSSYYLTIAIFGPALIFGEILSNRKTALLVVFLYFLMTVRGLDFLSKTHWIILKNTGPIGSF